MSLEQGTPPTAFWSRTLLSLGNTAAKFALMVLVQWKRLTFSLALIWSFLHFVSYLFFHNFHFKDEHLETFRKKYV